MNISSGISELNFYNHGNRIGSEKLFIWPVYNNGKVESIRPVLKKTESNVVFSKPSPEERDKILSLLSDKKQYEYTSSGLLNNKKFFIQPGSLFEAIV